MTRDRLTAIRHGKLEDDTVVFLTFLISEFRATTPDEEQVMTQAGQLRLQWLRDRGCMQSTDSYRDTEQPLPTHHHGDDMRPCPICSK